MGKSHLSRRLFREPQPLARLTSLGFYPWLVVGTVCIGAFIGQLDASIISLVLPTLEVKLRSSLATVQWVAIVYLLVLTALLTPLGHLADRVGRKALYTFGFLVFVAGSALCGLAPDIQVLIAARALQGVGAAMLQANSVAIITAAVASKYLGRAIGIQGTAQALGLAVGPAVGGLLIAWLGWRWVFLINVPIGLMGAVLARLALPAGGRSATAGSLNVKGATLLPLSVASVLLGFTFLHLAAVFLPLALMLLVWYVRSERRAAQPLLGGDIVKAPGLAAGAVAALLSYTMLFGAMLAVPLLLERVYGESPLRAGLVLTLVPLALAVVAELGGIMSDRAGPRLPTVGGMVLAGAGLMALAWAAGRPLAWLCAALVIFGLGMGLFIPANNASIMSAAPTMRLGVAGGLINTMRGIGASVGVALVSVSLHLGAGAVATNEAAPGMVTHGIRLSLLWLTTAAIVGMVLCLRRQTVRK